MVGTFTMMRYFIDAGVNVIITGVPGIGKTFGVRYEARRTPCAVKGCKERTRYEIEGTGEGHVHLIPLIATVRDPADVGGYPMLSEMDLLGERVPVAVLASPGWAAAAARLAEQGHSVWIFIDEIRDCSPATQAALQKGVHERMFGETYMPLSVRMILAGNSAEESSAGWALTLPMANRLAHLDYNLQVEEWCQGIVDGDWEMQTALTEKMASRLRAERTLISSYINAFQQQLLQIPTDDNKKDGPFPTPRSWDFAAHVLTAIAPEDEETRQYAIAACVGLDAAAQMVNWQREMDLPNPNELLDAFSKSKVTYSKPLGDKTRPDRTYAILNSVLSSVIENYTDTRYVAAWKICEKVANEDSPDIGAVMGGRLFAWPRSQGIQTPDVRQHMKPFVKMMQKAGFPV